MVGKELSLITIDDMPREDVAEVLSIERVSFSTPWSEILYMNEIYKAGSFPKVARLHERVVGYLCANQVLDEGHILNVTVHPDLSLSGNRLDARPAGDTVFKGEGVQEYLPRGTGIEWTCEENV